MKLNQPYAGIFLKKNDEDESEIVDKLSDIYEYGSFAQIQEMQDLGDKLRLVVIAHRRIKITNQLYEDLSGSKKKGINTINSFFFFYIIIMCFVSISVYLLHVISFYRNDY